MQPEEVAVTAAHVQEDVEAHHLTDLDREGDVAHARHGARPVRDIDHIRPGPLQERRRLKRAPGVEPRLGVHLDADDEILRTRGSAARSRGEQARAPDAIDLGGERGFLRHRHRVAAPHFRGGGGLRGGDGLDASAAEHAGGVDHRPDVLRPGPAAASDEAHSRLEHAARVDAEVLGRRHVERALIETPGAAGIRLHADRGAARDHGPAHFEEKRRSLGAVGPDDVGPRVAQAPAHLERRQPVDEPPLFAEGYLRDDGPAVHRAGRDECLLDLLEAVEGLEDQEVDPFLEQRGDLFEEEPAQRGAPFFRQSSDHQPRRADGAGHPRFAPRRLARQTHSRPVDRPDLVLRPVAFEALGVGAEGVGLQDLGARGHVVAVDVEDQVGAGEVCLVEGAGDEVAALVELRPHGAVEHQGTARQGFEERSVADGHRGLKRPFAGFLREAPGGADGRG